MKPMPLNHLTLICPSAANVWLALLEIANELNTPSFATTREKIADRCGVGLKTVTNGLNALESSHWIKRSYSSIKMKENFIGRTVRVSIQRPWKILNKKATHKKTAAEIAAAQIDAQGKPTEEQSEKVSPAALDDFFEGAELPSTISQV